LSAVSLPHLILIALQEHAKWLPPQIFKCPLTYTAATANSAENTVTLALLAAAAAPDPKPSCKAAADKLSCKGVAGCVWCEGSFGPGKKPKAACYSEVKAQFLPAQFFKCSAPSTAAVVAAEPAAAGGGSKKVSCKAAVDEVSCKGVAGCVWCEATFSPTKPSKGHCYCEVSCCSK
jgi:hypothetical protein